uniref:Zinc metalloproteinase n=1 Tax=Haemonchus contortus TaxID=6289 RepID=W6NDP8_HAECO
MEVFEKAAKAWESKTCLKFKKVNYGDTRELINVGALGGCFSSVGKTGKPQDLSLGDGCHTVGIAAHEIGHSLGLYHTMGRADRDKYVTVNMDKIRQDYYSEFVTYTVDVDTYGVEYDYGSIMHYGATSSAIDRVSITMLPTDEKYRETLGSPLISFNDFLVINRHYKCEAHCPKRLPCEMGGFPNPKNCNECVCPSGYGGAFCNDRPKGCGDKLKADKEWKHLSMSLGDGKGGDKDDFDFCNYWIETQPGSKIEVEIEEISFGISSDGCILGGVEIKTHANQQRTGYRFCSYMDKGMNLKSGGSRVPIILYNRSPRVDVTIKYRIGDFFVISK